MTIKLCTIDLDGTLLNSKNQLTAPVKEAIKKATQQGVKIVLCTGRPFSGVRPLLEDLELTGPDNYVATYNGSIVEKTDGTILIQHGLTYQDFIDIVAMGQKIQTPIQTHFISPEHLVSMQKKISPYTVGEAFLVQIPLEYRSVDEVSPEENIVKVMYINEPTLLDESIKKIPEDFYQRFTCVKSAPFFFEVLNKKAAKGNALAELRTQLGIEKEETMAIGDNDNDLSMIQEAGIGVAMGNAIPAIKEAADFISKTNDEHGVAYALEKFVLN